MKMHYHFQSNAFAVNAFYLETTILQRLFGLVTITIVKASEEYNVAFDKLSSDMDQTNRMSFINSKADFPLTISIKMIIAKVPCLST